VDDEEDDGQPGSGQKDRGPEPDEEKLEGKWILIS
jgi:hypothetical protein